MCGIDQTTIQLVTLIKDCVLAGVGVGTLIVAGFGLHTWNRQLRGTERFDAAKAHVHAALQLREAIREARSPFVAAAEFELERDRDDPSKDAASWGSVYAKRMKPVWDSLAAFDAALIQTEAVFGPDVRKASEGLRQMVFRLNSAVHAYLDNIASGHAHFKDDRDFGVRVRSDLAASSSSADNPFTIEINKQVDELLAYLRPHLVS